MRSVLGRRQRAPNSICVVVKLHCYSTNLLLWITSFSRCTTCSGSVAATNALQKQTPRCAVCLAAADGMRCSPGRTKRLYVWSSWLLSERLDIVLQAFRTPYRQLLWCLLLAVHRKLQVRYVCLYVCTVHTEYGVHAVHTITLKTETEILITGFVWSLSTPPGRGIPLGLESGSSVVGSLKQVMDRCL